MVGSSGGIKSSDVFGTFSSSPACGSTLQASIPLNPPCPQIPKAVYVKYKDHVFFRNVEAPAAEAIIREALGWVKEENDEVMLIECDRPLLQCRSGFNGVVVVKSCIVFMVPLNFEHVLNCPHTLLKNRVCAPSQRSEKLSSKIQKRSDKN
jgi:hypothetical protein